jgi:Skp family chaperone for outer membrane proteins
VKRIITLSGFIALAFSMVILTNSTISAQEKAAAARSKIAIINIAKVLRNYNKANAQGKEIADRRKYYLDQVNVIRSKAADKNKELAAANNEKSKESVEVELRAFQRQVEDIDRKAQKELMDMSNDTIVRVYKEVQGMCEAIATANGFEMILAYPDATEAAEEGTAVVAQLKLQTPALMPFYVRQDLDITSYVIKALNDRYPAAPVQGNNTGSITGPAAAPKQ